MTTVTFSLPQSMREFIEKQVAEEGFGTVSEYLRSLVRDDQKRKARAVVDQALLEGLNSGAAGVADDAYWVKKKDALVREHQRRKAG